MPVVWAPGLEMFIDVRSSQCIRGAAFGERAALLADLNLLHLLGVAALTADHCILSQ